MCKKVLCLMTLVLLLGLVSNASAALDAYWDLDDGSGTSAADSSGNGHTGTLTNGPVWTTGAPSGPTPDGAISLDGVDDHVVAAGYGGIMGNGPMSSLAWIKSPESAAADNWQDIVTWGTDAGWDVGRWELTLNYGRLFLGMAGGNVNYYDVTLSDGTWHHVAAVLPDKVDATIGDVKLFIDGLEVVAGYGNGTKVVNIHAAADGNENDVYIGWYAEGKAGAQFLGEIDEVRIYDSALTEAQIQTISGIPEPATVALLGLGGLALLRRKK